jgi:hypothetical protein
MVIILGIALILPGVALAAHYSISTTDNSVSDWAGVSTTVTDGADIADANWDINQAWVANNSSLSEMYFRINLVSGGTFPTDCNGCYRIEARLDCNRDNDFIDTGDVVVYYEPQSDSADECQGYGWAGCGYGYDANGTTYGQTIAGSPNNYEFKANTASGNTDWTACTGNIWVTFATYYYLEETTYDTTSAIDFNVPTAVKMNDISAHPKNENQAALVLIIAGALLITGQSIFKRKQA